MKFEKEVLPHEHEAKTDATGTPCIQRFVIHEPLSAETFAVVEAHTRDEARQRFERLRPFLRASLKAVVDDFFAVSPASQDTKVDALPLFNNMFFDVLECTDRLLH